MAKVQFTTTDPAEIAAIAALGGSDLPFRRDGCWWEATSVRSSRNGLTVWATSAEAPSCTKLECGAPATKLLTVSDGGRSQAFYRCNPCADGDERMIPRIQPWLTVSAVALEAE